MITPEHILYILGGYISGSVLYSYLLPQYIKKIDITKESNDGNPGAANAFLHGGVGLGICALTLELLKGYIPVHLAFMALDPEEWGFGLIMAAPVLGHAFSFWNPRMGGKSIAVSFGVLLGLIPDWQPVLLLAFLYLLFSLIIVIRPHFFRSVVTFLLFWGGMFWKRAARGTLVGSGILSCVVIWKHLVRYRNERLEICFPLLQKKREK